MSTPRLTFLYPHLFRSLRASEPVFQNAHRCCQQRRSIRVNNRSFSTTPRRQAFIQRHGKAVEPFLKEGEDSQNVKVFTPEGDEGGSKDVKSLQGDKEQKKPDNSSSAPLSEETQAAAMLPGDPDIENISAKSVGNKEGRPKPLEQVATDTSNPLTPLETVLRMPPPQSTEVENATKPPHLQTPPYVHHFDTYTLVQQVEAGGFTEAQAITAMKAVRGILAQNLEVAKAGLVSKSDVDNETYLFRAACSEVKTEVQNSRKKADEAMRRDRTLLTHEVDILNQKLTQELLAMKDELKGMFDDRRMSVRMEQRAMESAIQELNYKITVMLNSDSKSEVEGLRWVLTRRSVMGILFMAFMVLTSLRYASYKSHEEIENAKKKEIIKEEEKKMEEAPPQGVAEILAAN